jgi:hypothetical protein
MTHKLEFCGWCDQIVNDYVCVRTAWKKPCVTVTKHNAGDGRLVEIKTVDLFKLGNIHYSITFYLFLKIVDKDCPWRITNCQKRAGLGDTTYSTMDCFLIINLELYFTSLDICNVHYFVASTS